MRLPGWKRVQHSARWLRAQLVGRALILGYHHVGPVAADPYDITVSADRFAEQLEVLVNHARLVPLRELVDGLRHSSLPSRVVAVTFDDGYVDTLQRAVPLLELYEVPATIFLTTGCLGKPFWWDELVMTLRAADSLPGRLQLRIGDSSFNWSLDKSGPPSRQELHSLLLSLHRWLLPLSDHAREEAIDALRAWAGSFDGAIPVPRALESREIIKLAASETIEIGAHSVTHPLLGKLDASTQQRELLESRQALEKILLRQVRGFSYPNGSYSRRTLALVRQAGFEYACASFSDTVWHGSDPYRLPRFWVPNWDGGTFANWLRRWLR